MLAAAAGGLSTGGGSLMTLLIVITVSIAISFMCSILEAVLLSVTHSYVALLEERGSPAGALLVRMRRNIDQPIAAILTLNTIAHTVGAAVGGAMALEVFGEAWIAAFSAVLTLAILVFSEILPKTIGATYWQKLAPPAAYVLRFLIMVLKPVLVPLAWFNRLISPRRKGAPTVSRAELEVLAEMGRKEGVIAEDEWQVVNNVINLRDVRVGAVMTPRTSMVAVDIHEGVAAARHTFLKDGHSRLPIYRESPDDVVGVVLARDLWRAVESGETDLSKVMRPPRFVPESKRVEDLIRELRQERVSLAIVVDEYGGTAGLVTLEDLIEEIVGEIRDEHEDDPLEFETLPNGEVHMAGDVSLVEVNERLELQLPEEDYKTLAGYFFGTWGHVPAEGDVLELEGGRLAVVRMTGRRISRLAWLPDGDALAAE